MTPRASRWGPLALGTAEFGSRLPAGQCLALLERHHELGGRLIDTAPTYGQTAGGSFEAETLIGRWLTSNGADMQIATKAGLDPVTRSPDLDPTRLLHSARISHGRLHRIDLLLLHRDDPAVPVAELADVLSQIVTEGIAARIGVCNWNSRRVDALASFLARSAGPRLHSAGLLWSLARRSPAATDPELIEADSHYLSVSRTHGLHLLPFRTAALGFFAELPAAHRHDAYSRAVYDTPTNRDRRYRARTLGRHLGLTAHQVALAYLRCLDLPVTPVVGASTVAQLDEAAAGCAITLTSRQHRYLVGDQPL